MSLIVPDTISLCSVVPKLLFPYKSYLEKGKQYNNKKSIDVLIYSFIHFFFGFE